MRRTLVSLLLLVGCISLSSAQPFFQNPVTVKPLYLITGNAATGPSVQWPGGRGNCWAWGTWNGATVTLNAYTPDGTVSIPLGIACTFTANGVGYFDLGPALIQAVITGAGGSTSVSAALVPIVSNTYPVAK